MNCPSLPLLSSLPILCDLSGATEDFMFSICMICFSITYFQPVHSFTFKLCIVKMEYNYTSIEAFKLKILGFLKNIWNLTICSKVYIGGWDRGSKGRGHHPIVDDVT